MSLGKGVAAMSAVVLVLGVGVARADEPAGDWIGALATAVGELHLAVHLHPRPDGGYQGTLDSLDQGARDLALSDILATPSSLSFSVAVVHGRYVATWDGAQHDWNGVWSQGATGLPLKLNRGVAPPAPTVQGLDGDWDGTLDVNGARLRLAFHIHTTLATGTVATLDSIDQNAEGLGVSHLSRTGDQVSLDLAIVGSRFEGVLSADGSQIVGTWRQATLATPLTIIRRMAGAGQATLNRPQTPKGPFPYRAEDVAYDNPAAKGHVRLAGTLTLPKGQGPFPAVVLIAGSGPNTRDEEIFGHKLFLVLADHLTRQGLAVLRFDKRGVGQSTGDYATATTFDFASDVDASLAYLRTRKELDARRTGLIGHSEGGLIAPIVAAKDHRVAFVVLLAGPGENGLDVILQQGRLISKAFGVDDRATAEGDALRIHLFRALEDDKDPAAAKADMRRLLVDFANAHGLSEAAIDSQLQMLTSNWLRMFLTYDPAATLANVRCPVLAIAGSKDLQVPPEQNLPAIRKALAGDHDVTVQALPGLNHLFQPAGAGSPLEYASIETTMSPLALDTITDWILRHVAPDPG